MKALNLTVKTKGETQELAFSVKRMVNAGFVGRDQVAVKKHIEELRKEGIPAPSEVPTLYPVAPYLIMTGGIVEVVEESNSGEAEFVLLLQKGQIYVGAGSDHTDRKLEKDSIIKAKQMAPNVVSPVVWPYEEVKGVWDSLDLRSWVEKDGEKVLYQEGKLSEILSPEDLLSFVKGKVGDGDLDNMVIYSGTLAALGGEMIVGEGFEVELHNPATTDSLWCTYKVRLLDYVK
ncbi:MAG: DUF2848 domain-containing protein [Proteobacteria bacterium]|nr:DUF2848 domain-containing protein [Pseudomonadota bacterium]